LNFKTPFLLYFSVWNVFLCCHVWEFQTVNKEPTGCDRQLPQMHNGREIVWGNVDR